MHMIQNFPKGKAYAPVKYDPGVAFLYAHLHAALMLSAAYLNKIQM